MPKFPLDTAQIVALFMTSIFYGILLTTFVGCMRVLLWSRTEQRLKSLDKINFAMLIPALLMFIFASLDISFDLRQNVQAFVESEDAIEEFEKTSNWLVYMKMVDYVIQTFIGDGILIYRCWVIYGRKWLVIVAPVILWAGGTACGIATAYIEASLVNNPKLLNANNLIPFITSMLTLTLVTNIIVTSLIIHRIWTAQLSTPYRQTEKSRLSHVMRILIESGLIYTLSIIILFSVYLTSNNAQFAVSDAVVQIIGITFNLIIIRVHDSQPGSTHPPLESRVQTGRATMPLHSIQVHTTTTVSRYRDSDVISTPSVLARPPDSKPPVVWTTG